MTFLPRVQAPALMLNGQFDWYYAPPSRRLFFELLGSRQKKYVEIPGGGHVAPKNSTKAEALTWLDRYIGPVRMR